MKSIFILAGIMALALGSAQAETYRWVDSSGNLHYADQPPATADTKVEIIKIFISPEADNADLPYETRHAMQNFPVTLYTANNCIEQCSLARDFLNKRGIPFAEKALLTQEDITNFIKETGSDQTPTLTVGKACLKGFEAGPWNDELNIAGYPKIAPYRAAKSKPTQKIESQREPDAVEPGAEIP